MYNTTVEFEWKGLRVQGTLEDLGWQGDAEVPGGKQYLGLEVVELYVWTPSDDDIAEELDDATFDKLEEMCRNRAQ
jgi:hypothetical protein